MKKLIVVIMALITIFSVSVSAYASSGGTFVDWQIVDTILNLEYSSTNCKVVFFNSDTPDVNWTNSLGQQKFQKTTYNVMNSMYETLTVYGASLSANAIFPQVYHWFEYNGHCFIRITVESNITGSVNNKFWVGNGSGKILYCDAPASETTYTISAIAGATGYCLTDRPAGTTGNGYLGDLLVTQDNLTTIHGIVDGLGGAADYYVVLRIVNGEYRYYIMCTYPNRQQYFVCNTSGQLFYALRDEVTDDGGDTGGGSTFDPTEVITAINSVYDAVNSMSSNLGSRLVNILNATNGIGVSVENLAANVVTGFTGVQEQLSTLNSYFTDLSGLFPVQEEITLLGSDTRVAWDSADRITNVTAAGFNGDLIVKERPGDLVDESGYEKVTINETEYSLYNDSNGYRRIKANNEYPDDGVTIPDNTFCYFPFDNTLSSSVGDLSLIYPSIGTSDTSVNFSTGISGDSFVFNGGAHLVSNSDLSSFINANTGGLTFSFWIYPTSFATTSSYAWQFSIGAAYGTGMNVNASGSVSYYFYNTAVGSTSYTGGSLILNDWNHIAFCFDGTSYYYFLNGNLEHTESNRVISFESGMTYNLIIGRNALAGTKIDELILVNNSALWTSSFDAEKEAIFSAVAKDYFLACSDQEITLNFYDTAGEQVTEHRWNQYTVNTSRLPDGYSEVEYIESSGTQYVNTGFYPNQDTRLDIVAVPLSVADANVGAGFIFYGSGSDYNSNAFECYSALSAYEFNYDGQHTMIGSSAVGQMVQISHNKNSVSLIIDGVETSYSFNYNSFTSPYSLTLFAINRGSIISGLQRIYSCQIYDNGTLVLDFVPCKNPSNAIGLYDLVNGQFYGNSGTGSFTAGNEVSNGSGIGQLVGVVSSTNPDAYPDGGEQDGFYYEYIGAFTEYPSFSQTLSPTDVNGNSITMGRLEDDFSEIYMDISTVMWYCHDPQTQTEILLSSANQQIMNDTIYVRHNYTMLPADQITADALQNLLPVDSPVYLDMPEGAKLTITYDHYSGWFRMMYILMDKQTKLLSDLDIVSETIINVENTVIDITNNNPAYNVFYITKTDGTTESVGDAAKDAAVFVGDVLSMFYRLVFDDALDNAGVIQDFEDVLTTTNTGVNVW